MEATRTRAFGPARIVALALISVAVLGLASLHFGTGSDSLSAGHGDGSGTWFLALTGQLAFPTAQVWGDVAAVASTDAASAQRFFATPPQNATRALLPHLPNGHQVVLANLGHTDDFWAYEPAASGHLVNTFFDSGRVDASRYTPNRIDFAPGTSQGEIAKIGLGAMLGLAALTVFLLLWLPLRLRRRGSFGPTASGALRSASPLLFGLGGWFTGVLVVLMALPARFAADAIEIPEPATR